MRKQYSAPIIEKVVFDYTVQISTASQKCIASVMNLTAGGDDAYDTQCVKGTKFIVGWTSPNPVVTGDGN